VLGDGRNTPPLNESHVSGANGGQAIGQTPAGGGPASATRCGSCGGPSNGEELCPACQQAFSAMLRKAAPAPAAAAPVAPAPAASVPVAPAPVAPPQAAPIPAPAPARVPYNPFQAAAAPVPYNPFQAAAAPAPPAPAPAPPPQTPAAPAADGATRVDQELWAQLMGTPAPPPMDSFDLPASSPVAPLAAPPPPPPPLPPPPLPAGHTGPSEAAIRAAQIAAAQSLKAEPIKLEPTKPVAANAHATAAAPALHAPAPDRPVREAALPKAPSKPSPLAALLPSMTDRVAAGVGVLCVVGLAAGALWYHFRDNTAPMNVVADIVEPEQTDGAPDAAPAAAPAEPEPVQASASSGPRKPAAAAPTTPRKVADPRPPVANAPQPDAPAAAAAAVNVPRPKPVGQLFQPSEVNEAPRVVRRIEPRIPAALRGRKLDEIVVVRALVSKDGFPSRVTLLRRSKAGAGLDDAVVAAVNQWSFTPALKEGEPVNSWFNFAVPVSRPD
jgi:TonB family protein